MITLLGLAPVISVLVVALATVLNTRTRCRTVKDVTVEALKDCPPCNRAAVLKASSELARRLREPRRRRATISGLSR